MFCYLHDYTVYVYLYLYMTCIHNYLQYDDIETLRDTFDIEMFNPIEQYNIYIFPHTEKNIIYIYSISH